MYIYIDTYCWFSTWELFLSSNEIPVNVTIQEGPGDDPAGSGLSIDKAEFS